MFLRKKYVVFVFRFRVSFTSKLALLLMLKMKLKLMVNLLFENMQSFDSFNVSEQKLAARRIIAQSHARELAFYKLTPTVFKDLKVPKFIYGREWNRDQEVSAEPV